MEYCPFCKARVVKRGKNKSGKQQYYCKVCKKWLFDIYKFHNHFSQEEVSQICKYLVEGKSIRHISKITGKHRDTISRLLEHLAWISVAPMQCLQQVIKIPKWQFRFLWYMIEKRKRNLSPELKQRLIDARKS